MSRRKIAVTVGILFFVQMATAMVGMSLIQAFVDGNTARAPLTVGVLLMMCSGIAVVGIGLLMYQVLKGVNQKVAIWYPVLRIIEFTVSAAGGVYLLTQLQVVPALPAVGLHSDRHRRPHPQLPALRLTAGSSTDRRARSRRIRPLLSGSTAHPPRRSRHERRPRDGHPCSRLLVRVRRLPDLVDRERIHAIDVRPGQPVTSVGDSAMTTRAAGAPPSEASVPKIHQCPVHRPDSHGRDRRFIRPVIRRWRLESNRADHRRVVDDVFGPRDCGDRSPALPGTQVHQQQVGCLGACHPEHRMCGRPRLRHLSIDKFASCTESSAVGLHSCWRCRSDSQLPAVHVTASASAHRGPRLHRLCPLATGCAARFCWVDRYE